MARPVVSAAAEELYSSLGPWAEADGEDTAWFLLNFCEALVGGSRLQDLEDIVRDSDAGPGWSAVLDVNRAPAEWLPWLGQFVGVRPRIGLDEAGSRAAIVGLAGFRRGSPAALRAAAQQYLTGSKYVIINERVGEAAYQLAIRTLTSETPDPATTLAALLEQKPAGIILDFAQVEGHTYGTLLGAFGTYTDLDAAYVTYQALHENS